MIKGLVNRLTLAFVAFASAASAQVDKSGQETTRRRDDLLFQLANDSFKDGNYYTAAVDFERLVMDFPNSPHNARAREMIFESCFQLMKAGSPAEVLGLEIPFILTRERGLSLLRKALQRYPAEKFTPDYHMKLAEYFYDEREWDQAELEYRTIVELYPGSTHAAEAVMGLAHASERKFKGVAYDAEPLREAKRQYERFKDEFAQHKSIAEQADAKLKLINELLAKKDYEVAEYYVGREMVRSARFMFEEVRRRFPETEWAKKARARLEALPVPEPLPPDPKPKR
jgi:outer membrane protein assembly factor BamD (BamD/ComL family)